MGRRSITQRLLTAKSLDAKRKTAVEWADNWERHSAELIKRMEIARRGRDYLEMQSILGEMKEEHEKRFSALPKVLLHLMHDDTVTKESDKT